MNSSKIVIRLKRLKQSDAREREREREREKERASFDLFVLAFRPFLTHH